MPSSSDDNVARKATLANQADLTHLAVHGPGGDYAIRHRHKAWNERDAVANLRTYPEGTLLVRIDGIGPVSCMQGVRMDVSRALGPHVLADRVPDGGPVLHDIMGDWIYITQLILGAPPGIATEGRQLEQLLRRFLKVNRPPDIVGLALVLPFPGRRDRSGDTAFQRESIGNVGGPILPSCAHHMGLTHRQAMPHYFGEARHGALMTCRLPFSITK